MHNIHIVRYLISMYSNACIMINNDMCAYIPIYSYSVHVDELNEYTDIHGSEWG
jgi:hypothetical protein